MNVPNLVARRKRDRETGIDNVRMFRAKNSSRFESVLRAEHLNAKHPLPQFICLHEAW